MAEAKSKTEEKVVDVKDNHDRVAMLSIAKDGTPDQVDPEIIGDKEFALEATKRQFAENAVSAVDDARRAEADEPNTVGQDPTIEAAQKEHEKAAKKAESAAEKVVGKLHKD
jgi:hypothetical protein